MSVSESQIGKILAANVIPIIGGMVMLGGIIASNNAHSVAIEKLEAKVEEIELNKASDKDLGVLNNRVSKKIAGPLSDQEDRIRELELNGRETLVRLKQTEGELNTLWDNYNRLNCD